MDALSTAVVSFVERLPLHRGLKCIKTIGKPIIWDLEKCPL